MSNSLTHVRNPLTGIGICGHTGHMVDDPADADCQVCGENTDISHLASASGHHEEEPPDPPA